MESIEDLDLKIKKLNQKIENLSKQKQKVEKILSNKDYGDLYINANTIFTRDKLLFCEHAKNFCNQFNSREILFDPIQNIRFFIRTKKNIKIFHEDFFHIPLILKKDDKFYINDINFDLMLLKHKTKIISNLEDELTSQLECNDYICKYVGFHPESMWFDKFNSICETKKQSSGSNFGKINTMYNIYSTSSTTATSYVPYTIFTSSTV